MGVVNEKCLTNNSVFADEQYELLNRLINNDSVVFNTLRLVFMGEHIDYSRLDLANIEKIEFSMVQDEFDYLDFLNTVEVDFSFFGINLTDNLKEFLNSKTLEYSNVYVAEDAPDIISYLSDKKIPMHSFSTDFYDDYYSKKDSFLKFFPDLYADRVNLDYNYSSDSNLINLSITLNTLVKDLNLDFSSIVNENDLQLGLWRLLGTIQT